MASAECFKASGVSCIYISDYAKGIPFTIILDDTCTARSDNPPVPYKGVWDEADKPLRVGSKGAERARAELIGKVIAEQVVQYSLV